ncbi:hypothetical protein [Paenibacillus sp. LPE1-1-1.1]
MKKPLYDENVQVKDGLRIDEEVWRRVDLRTHGNSDHEKATMKV